MSRRVHLGMAFLALAWAQPSVACMDVNGPAYLLDRPPKSAPPGLALLKLRSPVAQPGNGSKFVAATIAGGVPARVLRHRDSRFNERLA